jgi:hypothetical protein
MKWWLYIKSHCDYPDIEDECEADSKEEAAKKFLTPSFIYQGWDEEMLLPHICEAPEAVKTDLF